MNQCDGSYDKRDMCNNPNECACTCQEHPGATTGKFIGAIGVGVGLFGVGITMGMATVATGGLAPAILASVATSAGISSAMNPISKKIRGERMTLGSYTASVEIGATVGAVTGGMGSGVVDVTNSLVQDFAMESINGTCSTGIMESIMDSCTEVLAKLGISTVVGGVTGDPDKSLFGKDDSRVVRRRRPMLRHSIPCVAKRAEGEKKIHKVFHRVVPVDTLALNHIRGIHAVLPRNYSNKVH